MHKYWILWCLSGCLLSASISVSADNQPQILYAPGQTTVAILPVIDETGAKDAKDDIAIAKKSMADQFTTHGFTVIDDAKVQDTISNLKIDLSDDEQQKQSTYYEIAKVVKANLVVFEIVTDKSAKESDSWFNLIGHARIKLWLLDVDKQQPILRSQSVEGRDGGRDSRTHYGSYLATHAVKDATEKGLKDFFKPYAVVNANKPRG